MIRARFDAINNPRADLPWLAVFLSCDAIFVIAGRDVIGFRRSTRALYS